MIFLWVEEVIGEEKDELLEQNKDNLMESIKQKIRYKNF